MRINAYHLAGPHIPWSNAQVSKDLKSAEMENTLQGLNDAFKDGLIQSIGLHCLPVRAESTADNIQELFLPEMVSIGFVTC